MAVLRQILENNGMGTPVTLSEPVNLVGRDAECQVKLESPAVSRRHARISQDGSRFFLEDTSSRNGTTVNGHRVTRRELLRDGDLIEFSTTKFRFSASSSLEDPSGTWMKQPLHINIADPQSESAGSIYRQLVRSGDRVNAEAGDGGAINEARILSRIPVSADHLLPLLTAEAPRKLMQSLQLLQSLRRMIRVSDVLAVSLDKLFEVFPAIEGIAVVEIGGDTDGLRVLSARDRQPEVVVTLCLPLLQRVIEHREALLYLDHRRTTAEPQPGLSELAARSILAAPLLAVDGTVFGAVQLDTSPASRPPDHSDLERLVIFSHVLGYSLEMAVETELTVHRSAMERATTTACDILARFSPSRAPEIPGFFAQHVVLAAPEIAGDLVDYISLSGGRTAVVLIDVPGRGVEAVGLMTVLSRVLTEALTTTGSAAPALEQTVDSLQRRKIELPPDLSVALMIVAPEQNTAVLSVAGHCTIFRVAQGRVEELRDDYLTGLPLGQSRVYRETELRISPGESLCLVTNGFSRLESGRGETVDDQRKHRMIRTATGQPEQFCSCLCRQIEEFRGGAPLRDDVAFAMIHRHSGTARDLVLSETGSRRPRGDS